MFWHFIVSAVKHRRGRLLLAFASMAVAATLVTALFSVYSGIESRVRAEFEGFGANLVIAPGSAGTVPLAAVDAAREMHAEAAPFLFAAGRLDGREVAVNGVDFAQAKPFTRYWQIEGADHAGAGECLIGSALAAARHLKVGSTAEIEQAPCTVRGIVATGGSEENQVLAPFATAARLAKTTGAASVIQVHAPGDQLEAARAALQRRFPESEVRIVHAVADTESGIVLQLRAALLLLTLVILVITALCVTSNFSELVLERSREIGLLKAIGAAERRIAGLFLSESVLLSGASALVGYAVGVLTAASIARGIFGGRFVVPLDWRVFLLVFAVTLLVAVASTALVTQRIWRIEPAMILRGE